ncbi:hypothetical protein HHI36_007395 [Cryptolaemus montrouzieri]|uniref:O-acyltransferase n=1 Tax=Cryptolaemus montrouzieri TaxID=559131 RepID=A0ABD2MQ80_9CUCU
MVHEEMKQDQNLPVKAEAYVYEDKLKNESHGLPEKHFVQRESLITVLFENQHLKTIHHISASLFLGLVVTTIARDYVEKREIVSGFRLIQSGFGKLPIALAGWVLHFCLTCSIYFFFEIWSQVRCKLNIPKSNVRKIWDYTGVAILLGYYIFSFKLAAYIVQTYQLSPASAAIILIEQTRMLMKVHAFVRSNIPKVFKYKEKSDEKLILPTFRHYVYFILVPTLVYRDEYPRTSKVRWRVVATHGLEILAVLIFYSFVMERFLIPQYKDFGIEKFTYAQVFLMFLETSFPGVLYLLSTFYLVLHLVQNFFAEILQFGDRMFYKDWWTSTDFTTWYRTWNVVVHDWLYTYIYKDCYEILFPKNKNIAKVTTFFISAIVHEWILMHMFGFLFPVLFFLFFILSIQFTHLRAPKNSILNILFWMSLSFGPGIMISGYTLEFFARYNNVPPFIEDFDFIFQDLLPVIVISD